MPFPPAPAAILFDLDGTLIDSLQDIAEANNHCLELLGLQTRPMDEYRHLVGEGLPRLAQRCIGQTQPWLVDRLAELTRARYRARPLLHTRPYAGMMQLIKKLSGGVSPGTDAGSRARADRKSTLSDSANRMFALSNQKSRLPLGVLSNKPHELTVPIVNAFWPAGTFAFLQGYDVEEHRKPSPHHVQRFCEAVRQPAAKVWLIGDTPTDLETARRAGATCVCVTWGFRPREELVDNGGQWLVDDADQLLQLISAAGQAALVGA